LFTISNDIDTRIYQCSLQRMPYSRCAESCNRKFCFMGDYTPIAARGTIAGFVANFDLLEFTAAISRNYPVAANE